MTVIRWAAIVVACLAYVYGAFVLRRASRVAAGKAAERVSSFGTVLAVAWPIVFAVVVILGVLGYVVMRIDRWRHRRSMAGFDAKLQDMREAKAQAWARDVERAREEERARNAQPWDRVSGDPMTLGRYGIADVAEVRPLSEQLTTASQYDRHEHVIGNLP